MGLWLITTLVLGIIHSLSSSSFNILRKIILRPECHVYGTNFEGWEGRIAHFLITLLAFTWLPGGLPVPEEMLEDAAPVASEPWPGQEQGGLPAPSAPHISLPSFGPNTFPKTAHPMSSNTFSKHIHITHSWTHFTEWGLNSSERNSKITMALSDSSGGNCVLLVVMFTGQGFGGIGRWANVLLDLSENSLSHFHFHPPKHVKWILCAVYRKWRAVWQQRKVPTPQPLLHWVTFLLSCLLTLFWNRLFTKPRTCSWVALIWVL